MDSISSEVLRKINLIEVLSDEAGSAGRSIQSLPDSAAREWSEDQIRAHFCSAEEPSFPPPSPEEFHRWFPGLALSRTACAQPRWRVVCFANAGNAEDLYTSEGTGARRSPSPLLEWCRANSAECLAVQLPGRAARGKEQFLGSCCAVAEALLPIVASRLLETPYLVVAHSVGTWCAYELLVLARARGLPLPRHAFLSGMAAPDIPAAERPWRRQAGLTEAAFREECRGWDINEVVFSETLWGAYQPLLRADFRLFDEYAFTHAGEPPLECALTTFWGSRDRRITDAMVARWREFFTAPGDHRRIEGHHLWPLERESKRAWLQAIVDTLG